VEFGRHVSTALQNFTHLYPSEFETWWEPRQQALHENELTHYFYKVRNPLMKEIGQTPLHLPIAEFDFRTLVGELDWPIGATALHLGDSNGGAAWEVQHIDGNSAFIPLTLLDEFRSQLKTKVYFPLPPRMHKGQPITDESLNNLCGLFVAYLDGLVDEAEQFARALGDPNQ
jgi:hypothetical protein